MTANRRINLALVLLAIVAGLFIGMQLTEQNVQVAQAASQERGLAAMQAARGAMDVVKYDMTRAGYLETSPAAHSAAVRVTPTDPLQLVRASSNALEFRSPDGRENISYRFEGGRLVRTVSGKQNDRLLLLDRVSTFKVQAVEPGGRESGKTVNLAFVVPMSTGGGRAPVFAHFVNSNLSNQ